MCGIGAGIKTRHIVHCITMYDDVILSPRLILCSRVHLAMLNGGYFKSYNNVVSEHSNRMHVVTTMLMCSFSIVFIQYRCDHAKVC